MESEGRREKGGEKGEGRERSDIASINNRT